MVKTGKQDPFRNVFKKFHRASTHGHSQPLDHRPARFCPTKITRQLKYISAESATLDNVNWFSIHYFSSSIGADVFPLLLGQTIGSLPMLIMYLQLAIIVGCLLLFIASAIVGNKILKMSEKKSSETKSLAITSWENRKIAYQKSSMTK